MKYHSPNTDLAALQRELAGSGKSNEKFDGYDEYLDEDSDDEDDDEDEDEGGWAAPRRR